MPNPEALTPMAAKFVEGICKGLTPKEAAEAAGAIPRQAGIVARRYLRTNPVKLAIDAYNAQQIASLREKAAYDVEAACRELDQGMAFAQRTNNANANAKCIELKAKLYGLMDKSSGDSAANFQINILGVSAPKIKELAHNEVVSMEDLLR